MDNTSTDQMIDDYLRGRLSREAHIAFKKQMLQNPELAELVAINKNLYALHDTDNWNEIKTLNKDGIAYQEYLLSDEAQQIKTAINNAQNRYKHQTISPKKRYRWYGVAASFVLLIALFFTYSNTQNTPENLYQDYNNLSELPSLTQRSDTDKLLSDAEQLFLNKQYSETIVLLEAYEKSYTQTSNSLIYKGMCYLELNNTNSAITVFNVLKNSDYLDKNKAYWYIALCYLKQQDFVATKKTLNTIIDNSYYNHEEANSLLMQLN